MTSASELPSVMIRPATVEDAEQIGALTAAAYAQWVPVTEREPIPMTTDDIGAIATHIVDVLERNGQVSGVLELVSKEDHLLIENIAIVPEQQGKGLGSALLKHAENVARKLGHSEVRLYTNALFTLNLKFYEARGYSVLETSAVIPGSITVNLQKML